MKVTHSKSGHRDPKKNLHYSRSRPEFLVSASGIVPAPSLGNSESSDLGPTTNKKRYFLDPEIAQYRTLLGLACSAAAYSDNLLKEPTRKHLFDYLQWIHTWMCEDMDPAAYVRLVRRLEASRRRWELVRNTFLGELDVDMGVWEGTEPYKEGLAEDNKDIDDARTKLRRITRANHLERTGDTKPDLVIPDSEDEED
ncbi:hypothetical protein P7C70_g7037, partial [Phenoliferia sp. Uapishka_3]